LRPDIAHKRRRWQALQPRLDPDRLVFIDETWVKTNMAPLRGCHGAQANAIAWLLHHGRG